MHLNSKLAKQLIDKFRFKGWLTNGQTVNDELYVNIFSYPSGSMITIHSRDNFSLFNETFDYLQKHYFQDLLNPTRNELILFELERGFEWPLQDKFRLTRLSYNNLE